MQDAWASDESGARVAYRVSDAALTGARRAGRVID